MSESRRHSFARRIAPFGLIAVASATFPASAASNGMIADPTRPAHAPSFRPVDESGDESNMQLRAIFFASGRRVAIIDDESVREGETISGATVLAIESRLVRLVRDGQPITLEITPPLFKRVHDRTADPKVWMGPPPAAFAPPTDSNKLEGRAPTQRAEPAQNDSGRPLQTDDVWASGIEEGALFPPSDRPDSAAEINPSSEPVDPTESLDQAAVAPVSVPNDETGTTEREDSDETGTTEREDSDEDIDTARNEDSDDDNDTARNEDSDDDTDTARNEDSDDDTDTARNEDSDDDNDTARNEDSDDDTDTARNEDSEDDTDTARNEDSDDDTDTARNEDSDGDTDTARNEDSDGDTDTARNQDSDIQTETAEHAGSGAEAASERDPEANMTQITQHPNEAGDDAPPSAEKTQAATASELPSPPASPKPPESGVKTPYPDRDDAQDLDERAGTQEPITTDEEGNAP